MTLRQVFAAALIYCDISSKKIIRHAAYIITKHDTVIFKEFFIRQFLSWFVTVYVCFFINIINKGNERSLIFNMGIKKTGVNMSDELRKKLYLDTTIIVTDNKCIEIENCRKITEYNDIYICLKTPSVTVRIWGNDLKISDYKTGGLVVEGTICSIEFE